jgi:ABC-2 type transport system permease protein
MSTAGGSTLTGTGGLIRLVLRRDRVLMPLWILVLGLLPISYVSSFAALFPTDAERESYAAVSAGNAAFTALYGRLAGSSMGELVAWRSGFLPVMVGLITALTVIRHTRVEEDTGRRELLGATVVGRHAGLVAALVTAGGANVLLGAVLAGGMLGEGLPVAGSVAFGAELALAGWVFAGVGAVAAQLSGAAGGARAIAAGVLGAAYLLRVVGDIGGGLSWASWVSPIGWVLRLAPYGAERWWIVGPAAALTVVLATAAVALSAGRDVGAGLLPARLGPATGAPGLRSPLALAWRLHRGLLTGWTVGFAVVGVVLGGAAEAAGEMVDDNPNLQDVFARIGGRTGIIDSYLSAVVGFMGLLAAAYAIQAALRLRAEESSGRAEPVLSTAVGRFRWAGSHLMFSILGPAVALTAAGLAIGLTHGLNTDRVGHEVPRVLAGALVQLPAVWVLAAAAVLLVGLAPRLAPVSWGALAACLLIGFVGAALRLHQWLLDLSPFTHVPKVPGSDVSATPLAWLVGVALALGAAGLVGLRRRDIPA